MLKQLILASATAAIALTAAADFSTGSFGLTSDAEAKTSREAAQATKLTPIPAKPTRPGRKSPPGSSGPEAPGGFEPDLLPDLYFDFYPATVGAGDGYFCSQELDANQRPKFAEVKVYSKGNKTVGVVEVQFVFVSGGPNITKRVFMDAPNTVKTVSARIPDAAWGTSKAGFNILIDRHQKIAEDNENNNTTGGHCLDPNS